MTTDPVDLLASSEEETDPQATQETIAAPIAVELNSDEAWQDFQDTQAQFDEQFLLSLAGKA